MCYHPVYLEKRKQYVPCGECLDCVTKKSVESQFRLLDEQSQHKETCYITLTYGDDCPDALRPKDLQDFLKRLRERIAPIRIRFFACGEYGGEGNRPHYHLLVFGWKPDDMEYFFTNKAGDKVYRSPFVAKVWKHGFVTLGDISYRSAKYCAKYLQKLDTREHAVKPFLRMSNRPGVGYGAINERLAERGYLLRRGQRVALPRYYKQVLERRGYTGQLSVLKIKNAMRLAKNPVDVDKMRAKRERLKEISGSRYRLDKWKFDDFAYYMLDENARELSTIHGLPREEDPFFMFDGFTQDELEILDTYKKESYFYPRKRLTSS